MQSDDFVITYRADRKPSTQQKTLRPLALWAERTGLPIEHWESLGLTDLQNKFVAFNWPNGWQKLRDVTMSVDELVDGTKTKRRFFWTVAPPGTIHPMWPTPTDSETHEEIWLTEGESDTAVLRYLGLDAYTYGAATNVPGPVELRLLKRIGVQRVIITFDADKPGREHAPKLDEVFAAEGIEPLNLDINTSMLDLDYAKDIRDMYAAIGGPETLKRLKGLLHEELQRQEIDLNYRVRLEHAESPQWVWDGLVAKGGLTLLYGPAKAGKTTLVYQMIAAMRSGGNLLTRHLRPQRILYYSEMPQAFDYERVQQYLSPADDEKEFFFVRFAGDDVFRGKSWPAIAMLLEKDVKRYEIDYVILDTANEWLHFETDEIYSTTAVTEKLRPLRRLSTDTGCTVQINHHPPKAGTGPFGSIAFQAYVDCLLELSRDENASTLRAIGRIRSDFESVRFRLEQTGYAVLEVDDQQDVMPGGEGMKERVLQILPLAPESTTIQDLADDPVLQRYSIKSLRNLLNDLLLRDMVNKVPGTPSRWQRAFSFEFTRQNERSGQD